MRGAVPLILLLPLTAWADDKKPRYEYRANHDPNGIGKFYMGREIAQVMGYQAAGWLERRERDREEEPAKLLKALELKGGMVVADVGAGSGYHAFRMAPLVGPEGKVIAVDVQPQMLRLIEARARREKVKNVEPVRGTETDPKLPEGGVDLILMVDVYHEFSHPYEMTEKLVKALRPGGRMVFVEFRLEDPQVPIKLVHKMSERQVLREMGEFPELEHTKTDGSLPWQHIIIFTKKKE
jgi:precorrin-6B methylase 2